MTVRLPVDARFGTAPDYNPSAPASGQVGVPATSVGDGRTSNAPRRQDARLLLVLLVAYLVTRAVAGALVNPPYNGPDESGHVEYVRGIAERGIFVGSGAEAKQPPTYYAVAALIWRVTAGTEPGGGDALPRFLTRLLSGLSGLVTVLAAWQTARSVWPDRHALAAACGIVVLAPGVLYLLSSVSNDPAAIALASLVVLAATRLWQAEGRRTNLTSHGTRTWWALLIGAGATAVAIKLTTLPVVIGALVVLAVRFRAWLLTAWRKFWWLKGLAVLGGAGAVTGYAALLNRPATSGYLPALAHAWLPGVLRAPSAYLGRGGLAETFRTFWYAYDFAVEWPRALDIALGASAAAVSLGAVGGLVAAVVHVARSPVGPASFPGFPVRRGGTEHARRSGEGSEERRHVRPAPLPPTMPSAMPSAVPSAVWAMGAIGAAQVFTMVVRYGFGDHLQIEMGGAAQAKSFLPALVPLSMLFVAGLAVASRRFGVHDRLLVLGLFCWIVALDAVSLAVTLWQHYRWWQVILP